MKNVFAKRLLVAVMLTTWVANPVTVFAVDASNWSELGTEISNGAASINLAGHMNANGAISTAITTSIIGGTLDSPISIISDGADRFFTLGSGSNVGFQGVQLSNGYNAVEGGAVSTLGGLTIKDSVFASNKLTTTGANGGGALFINSGNTSVTSLIENSVFEGNEAVSSNPFNETDAGAISLRTGALTINDTNFIANKADVGGAIYVRTQGEDVSLEMNGGKFERNQATLIGGAIAVMSKAVLSGVKFIENKVTANDDGGGAMFLGSDSNTTIDNAKFSGNESASSGGAIGTRASVSPDGTELRNNSNAILTISNTEFTGNKATTTGGAIDNYFYNLANKITNSTFIKNIANKGGAIANHSDLDYAGKVPSMTVEGSVFEENTATSRGGAIYNEGNLTVGGEFKNNHADSYGGAIYSSGNLTITEGSIFTGNTTDFVGGAIAVAVNPNSSLTIEDNVVFKENTALYDGGAIGNYYTSVIASNVNFVNNKAQTGSSDSQAIGGGAISLGAESKTSLSNAIFTGNISGYDGGAIGSRHSLSADNSGSKLTIKDSIFDGNKALGTVSSTQGIGNAQVDVAGGNGGAIANHLYKGFDDEVGVQISGSSFINNLAVAYGGAIYNGGSADVKGNKANIVIADSTFTNNTSALGGAIYNASEMTLDAKNADITFSGNTDANGANDLYLTENSSTNIKGANKVVFGGGIAGAFGSVVNNIGNIVLAVNSINEKFLGTYNQTAGSTTVSSNFFGGESNITGGQLILNDGAKIVAGSAVNLTGADVDASGNVVIDGILSATSGTFDLNDGVLTITGDQSSYKGDFTQSGDNSITEISAGTFFGGVNNINGGKFVVKSDAFLASDVTMAENTQLDLDGRTIQTAIVDGVSKVIVNDSFGIIGSIVLDNTIIDTVNGVNGDIVLGDDSSLIGSEVAGVVNVDINNNSSLTVTSDSNIANVDTVTIGSGATLALKPEDGSSLSLNTDVIGSGAVEIADTDSNISINSDNSGFTGSYNQESGVVSLASGATFFGGSNTVEGDGKLLLEEGSLLASDVNVVGDITSDVVNLASIEFSNSLSGITQTQISDGNFVYDSVNGTNNVLVQNATVILANNTIISELDSATNSLVLSTNTISNEGVRLLGMSNGSGVDGDITLKDGTGVAYGDEAYIKQDSTITMANADLIFANDSTNIDYNPVIVGSGKITMVGDGTTAISSALTDAIDINVGGGELILSNTQTTGLGDINVDSTSVDKAVLNVASQEINIGALNVIGDKAQAHFAGVVNGTDVLVDNGTLGLYRDSTLNSLVLGSTLSTLDNANINTVTASSFTLNEDSSYFFDANPRTGVTDNIVVGTFTNNIDPISSETAKLIISGIAFTESPIDSNVSFDISNILTANSGDTTAGVVQMQSGGVVANSAMGRYLITFSGTANALNATLMQLNPQMYRGQVATIASWQNQLVVNNMMFDHMQVVSRQLMQEERTANKYAAAYPQFAPYQYSAKDGNLWYKAYGVFETLSMTRGLHVGNNAYGSLIGADFPLVNLKNGWKLVPTAYVGYNGGHQHFNGVSMYQNGAQLGLMGTAYKGDFLTSLLAYGGGYGNDMTVRGQYGNGNDNTGNWFAGVASKTAYNFHLTDELILQPTALVSYNAFGTQNWGSNFGAMSMSTGMLNGVNAAPGVNLIWQKKSFSLYATAQMVYNIMGGVDGQAGNIDTGYVRMKHSYFEYGVGIMKQLKDRFSGYFQITIRNGGRTGIGFQGGISIKVGK